MNLNEFQELSKRTMPYNGEPTNQVEFENMLGNYAMGLVGETMEFTQVTSYDDALKEIGDVMHYAVGLLACLGEGVNYQYIYELAADDKTIPESLCFILEAAKKHIYHRHELDRARYVKSVHTVIKGYISEFKSEEVENILQMNIDKLKTRYPESFNTADSINRVDVASNK